MLFLWQKGGEIMVDDATSVGKIQLEVEINQKSLNLEMNKLSKIFSNNFKNMFGQTNNFVKGSIGRMASNFKNFSQVGQGSSEKVAQSIGKMNAEYEKTESIISEIRNELAGLFAQQDEIARNYEDFPSFTGRTKDESIELMLGSDSRFNELSAQIDKLINKLDPLIEKNKHLKSQLERVDISTEKTSESFRKIEQSSKKAGKGFNLFGKEAHKASGKVSGFAHMLDRSFRRILRRIFILNLIYKLIRGFMNYLNSALKTNRQFANSLNIIATNLRVAFQPIYDFILPALNALMKGIATVTTYVASAISSLFGKSYQQSYGAAKGLDNAKKAMEGYGKSAKKAQGQLASFDEINQLDISEDKEDAGDGSGFEMAMPDTSTIDLTGFEKFKDMLQPTIDSLSTLGIALKPLKDFTAQGLKDFYSNFLKPVGQWTLGEGLPRFIDAITNGLSKINWQPINDGLNKLWTALTPFAINVGEGLLWLWENVLVLLGTWTMNNVVPIFLDILAESIKILSGIIEVFKPLGFWLWENFLEPLAQWTGGAIVDILEGIAYAFDAIADYIGGIQEVIANSDGFLDALVDVGIYLVNGLFRGIISALSAVGSWLKENLVDPIVNWVKKLFGIESPSTVFAEIGVCLVEGLFQGISDTWIVIAEFFDTSLKILKVFFEETWVDIREKAIEIWNTIKTFLIETIWNPIKTVAQQIWEAIKENILNPVNQAWIKLKDVWAEIKKYILGKWNEIKQGIADMKNKLVSAIMSPFDEAKKKIDNIISAAYNWGKNLIQNFIDGIKAMIGKVRDAVSRVADTVKGFLGFSSPAKEGPGKTADKWMPNLMQMLADGIQDNIYEVSAAVNRTAGSIKQGLQPNDTNNIASAVGSAVMGAMQFAGSGSNDDGNKEIVIELDGVKLGRVLLPRLNEETQRMGYKPILDF